MTIPQEILPFLSIWGAVLSTTLGVIKVWELYRDRFRLMTSYCFRGLPELGNEIVLYNPTKTPIMINYFELEFHSKGRFFYKKSRSREFPEDDEICHIEVPAYSRKKLTFSEQDHFDWGKQKIYVVMHVVGKSRPIRQLLYKP